MTCGNLLRHARIEAETALRAEGRPLFRLRGGPMDEWAVGDDADALREDWYTTWPESTAAQWEPGRYVLQNDMEDDARVAQWVPYEGKPPEGATSSD
jgi:hypothetical protein